MAKKLIYIFRAGRAEGRAAMRDLLGGKGAGLAEMSRSGVRVPPGFTITTEACRIYATRGGKGLFGRVPGLRAEFDKALVGLERASGKRFGDAKDPLLVSVRSGASVSMPGMMDTILNLGINAQDVGGIAAASGDRRFALDSLRRFIQMFGNVVRGIEKDRFEEVLGWERKAAGVEFDRELSSASLDKVIAGYLKVYREAAGCSFPEEPRLQLELAVEAVFRSWNNPRAAVYRRLNRIPDDLGTACTVQQMVFGNRGDRSGTGVGFTRDPSTGAKEFYGEFLPDAQGEDVVAGIRTPLPLAELKRRMPKVYAELRRITSRLEKHYRDVQDFEFTIERGRLFMLQTRTAKRSAAAALRTAVDMVAERLITKDDALLRVSPAGLNQLLKPVFEDKTRGARRVLARGLPAGPGAATGRIVFSAEEAERRAVEGPVLLVRSETNPDDIGGMTAAQGILTATGGLTSHAAVVGRGMGKVCVVGCGALRIGDGVLEVDGLRLKEGAFLSIDGFTGEVIEGQVPTQPSEILQVLKGDRRESSAPLFRAYKTFMGWADKARRLRVRANADRAEDARTALLLGAEGIGLCRTEHMFFGEERISKVLAMIVAANEEERRAALSELYPLQKEDFKEILRAMAGLPVTIRTLDPPLHEFLPLTRKEAQHRGKSAGLDADRLWTASRTLKESNPMLGHRGCRLGITFPELTEMQARAILAAAAELAQEGVEVLPEVMIPLVGFASELRHQKAIIERVEDEVGGKARCEVGTMIEVPRAAFAAAEIAVEAAFFSFGTNDLTQLTLGYSRDDYGKFIGAYLSGKILSADPFQTIDPDGVGAAVELAVKAARRAKPGIKLGVCGEHGGDPESIELFNRVGLDYVSCSPYRVPIARLAAAQAALKEKRARKRSS